ncbi:poly(R)-hydroxyalkanoic acid synthase [Actibacterium mucosum KCTC 23349]|uniref:Poly(R)-hydroxyalkanoic acid synthase n=1 Tax=Actibacterium mucosum KCTC 23349 TaxID=1454373 RepID=A0A037ZF44_9RHOB|nr:class I poly(R)-hydroxyalkanoic acid synthase [Actibacterium mucosum]KAJ54156.1 poly(R)-hydroxyalkanoic acid synthase [Actibacterium mucosum KCTC 23349]
MTTDQKDASANLEKLNENLARVEELSERLVTALSSKRQVRPSLNGPGQDLYMKTTAAYLNDVMHQPSKIFEQQVAFWGKTVKHFIEAQEALATGKLVPPKDETPKDPRFTSELWQTHPYFNYLKQQYLTTSEAIREAVEELDGLDEKDRRRIRHFTQQVVDLMAPTNFLGTNPEALAKAVETEGESLVLGLENLVRDVEANDGEVLVTLADKNAFKVGENLATTPGKVVFRNRMMELIQYAPATEKVHATPLIIFPPWINKFYIMDLKAKNSLIKWIVDQGFTLFVVSWVNPDKTYADVGMDTYVQEGYLTAIDVAKKITGEKSVNVVGYCIAGTTLSMVLGLLKKRKDRSVKSATFFTTLTDFSDQGEFSPFLDDDFVDGIQQEVEANGILESFYMSRTFSYLRANDLIYRPAIRSYMMGEAPPAFDLLYWNGDGTNLPGRMTVEYLRGLCQGDKLANEGFLLCGETLTLKDVTVPLCAIACETDHIAAWNDSYRGIQKMASKDKTFIMSESGHIAGIINPPSKKKYGHYTNESLDGTAQEWLDSAEFTEGSWWPRWGEWLAGRAGKKVDARVPGSDEFPALEDAPGRNVQRSD